MAGSETNHQLLALNDGGLIKLSRQVSQHGGDRFSLRGQHRTCRSSTSDDLELGESLSGLDESSGFATGELGGIGEPGGGRGAVLPPGRLRRFYAGRQLLLPGLEPGIQPQRHSQIGELFGIGW